MKNATVKDYLYAAMFAAVTSILSYFVFPLPFSPVPVTGQTLAVMLAGTILTPKQAALSMAAYIALGAVGIPVFAGGSAGLGVIFGPKGGYIFGFFLGAIVIAWIKSKVTKGLLGFVLANFTGGIVIVYISGVLWLNYVTSMGIKGAIMAGVVPFIPGDLFKLVAASLIGYTFNKRINGVL